MSHLAKEKATEAAVQTGPSLKTSPRSARGAGGNHNQTDLRGAVAQEMVSEILECPLDAFLDHYAPFVPTQESINRAFQAYNNRRTNPLLKEVDDGGEKVLTWTKFVPSPAKSKSHEVAVFKHLQGIVNFLKGVRCSDKDGQRKCCYSYRDCPSATMKSEIVGTNFRVDACITSNPGSKDVILSDTAAIAEFKKAAKAADVADNREKLVSAASHILNDDPRRTWIYGITIEDTRMSVWYFCRSHSVKSESFDFTRDIKKFIQVFQSLLYATPEEIGYDPTVRRVSHDDNICYVYQMGTKETPRYFRTKKLLFTPRVLCITGRKTRVWEAIEVEGYRKGKLNREKGRPVALKDGWLDEGSRTEEEIQAAIFSRLESVEGENYQWASKYLRGHLDEVFRARTYKDYFMVISHSMKIATTKARIEAAKPKPSILASVLPALAGSKNIVGGSTQDKDHSGLPSSLRPAISETTGTTVIPRTYKVKQQHRLIYNDVGYPLHHAKDLTTSFNAIMDACIALVLMYLASWTHRDVSTGNIIVLGDGNLTRGKLSDLEYAKEFDDMSCSADPKTGTPYFMPLEIHASERFYVAPVSEPSGPGEEGNPFVHGVGLAVPTIVFDDSDEPPPPKFRFQHDLESLWWIILWILLCRVSYEGALEVARVVFTYDETPTRDRRKLFTKKTFANTLASIIPKELSPLVRGLDNIRAALYFSYVSEKYSGDKVMLETRTYSEIYRKVCESIGNLVLRAKAIPYDFDTQTPGADTTAEQVTQKRLRSESSHDESNDNEEQTGVQGNDDERPQVKKPKPMLELARRQMQS